MNQLGQLLSVHFKEFFREPGIIFWAIFFPILMALGLGLAFSGEGDLERNVAVVGGNTSLLSEIEYDGKEQIVRKVGNEKLGATMFRFHQTTWEEAISMIKQGKTSMIIDISRDSLIYHFDPSNPEAKLSYLQLSSAIEDPGTIMRQERQVTIMKQEGTRYIDFLIPGLMAMGIMMNCMWGISYSNVDKRNKKLLRRMVATPMKKRNFIFSQLLARISLSAVEIILLYLFSTWIFNITITGSIIAFILMFIAGNIAFTGIAFLASSRTENTQIANGLINLVVLPMMILSGIYFSYHNFPDWMIGFIEVLPLTILADEMRRIFIEGATVIDILPKFSALILFGIIFMTAGLKIYKWY